MSPEDKKFRLLTSISSAIHIAYGGRVDVHCPHCNQGMTLPVLPLTPIVVCACINCGEYVVPFAGELIPLSKSVVESGQDADIRFAITQGIMKLLHTCVQSMLKQKLQIAEGKEFGEGKKLGTTDFEVPESMDDLEKLWGEDGE